LKDEDIIGKSTYIIISKVLLDSKTYQQ